MQRLLHFFQLIRSVNLFYIAFTQVLVYFFLVTPNLLSLGYQSQLSLNQVIMLVVSTLTIAAAGYIINDYFDVKADELNKPHRIFIGRSFSRQTAMFLHTFFNLVGIVLGGIVAWQIGVFKLIFIQIGVAALLWYYSIFLKKKALIGNIVVSLLTAFVVVLLPLYDMQFWAIQSLPKEEIVQSLNIHLLLFSGFAFLTNWQREMVKDMEDIEGDRLVGCTTLPITKGISFTKQVVALLLVFTMVVLFFVLQLSFPNDLSDWGMPLTLKIVATAGILLLMLLNVYLLKEAQQPKDFKTISNLLKLIMLAGIALMILV